MWPLTSAYSSWIRSQEEPEEVILKSGKYKREPTAMAEKNRLIQEQIDEMGIEEYRRRVQEDIEMAEQRGETEL